MSFNLKKATVALYNVLETKYPPTPMAGKAVMP